MNCDHSIPVTEECGACWLDAYAALTGGAARLAAEEMRRLVAETDVLRERVRVLEHAVLSGRDHGDGTL